VSLRTEIPAFTVPLYVRRAHLAYVPPPHFAIQNTFGTFEELQGNLRAEWRRRHPSGFRTLTDEQVDRRLNDPQGLLYAWVPGPIDEDVLADLDEAYPRLTFIIHHGADSEPSLLPRSVLPVTPPLTWASEEAMLEDYESARSGLDG
jgi:hypothetical protein